jgi:hypothetical protein
MKTAIFCLLLLTSSLAQAEDWVTRDGKVYKNVSIVGQDSESVTIWYDGGATTLRISSLPLPVQKKLGITRTQMQGMHEHHSMDSVGQ